MLATIKHIAAENILFFFKENNTLLCMQHSPTAATKTPN